MQLIRVNVILCQDCQDSCSIAEVQRTTEGQTALLQRGGTAVVPLLVEHSHISDPEGQRLVSVIQYTIIELFYHLAPRRRYIGVN